jgi:hypothetical protein
MQIDNRLDNKAQTTATALCAGRRRQPGKGTHGVAFVAGAAPARPYPAAVGSARHVPGAHHALYRVESNHSLPGSRARSGVDFVCSTAPLRLSAVCAVAVALSQDDFVDGLMSSQAEQASVLVTPRSFYRATYGGANGIVDRGNSRQGLRC